MFCDIKIYPRYPGYVHVLFNKFQQRIIHASNIPDGR